MEKLLTLRDVCKILIVQPGTVYGWIHKKKIPIVKLSNRMVRFKATDIEKWLEDKSQKEERI